MATPPRVLGIGGTLRANSSSERCVERVLDAALAEGALVRMIPARTLDLPYYGAASDGREADFLDAVRWADGLVLGSPGYHGTISGLLKNTLDHLEALRGDDRVYLDSMPVGLVACAFGDQAAVSTLTTMRSVVHALRGWPTPLGVTVNSALCTFDEQSGAPSDAGVAARLAQLGGQVVDFCRLHRRLGAPASDADALAGIAW